MAQFRGEHGLCGLAESKESSPVGEEERTRKKRGEEKNITHTKHPLTHTHTHTHTQKNPTDTHKQKTMDDIDVSLALVEVDLFVDLLESSVSGTQQTEPTRVGRRTAQR